MKEIISPDIVEEGAVLTFGAYKKRPGSFFFTGSMLERKGSKGKADCWVENVRNLC